MLCRAIGAANHRNNAIAQPVSVSSMEDESDTRFLKSERHGIVINTAAACQSAIYEESGYNFTAKELPQPHLAVALGFLMAKPALARSSV